MISFAEAGGLRLHHIGYAAEKIEPIAAEYMARFGYLEATPILHDPLQTAYVQFLRLPGDSAYLEFVAPDGPLSKLRVAVGKGGGLNHLCYSCAALEPQIAHLQSQGMRLVPEPRPGAAFAGRRICWLFGPERVPIELVERRGPDDLCVPGSADSATVLLA